MNKDKIVKRSFSRTGTPDGEEFLNKEYWIAFDPFLKYINKTFDDVNDYNLEIGSHLIMKDVSLELSCFILSKKNEILLSFPTPSSNYNEGTLSKLKISCGMLPSGISREKYSDENNNYSVPKDISDKVEDSNLSEESNNEVKEYYDKNVDFYNEEHEINEDNSSYYDEYDPEYIDSLDDNVYYDEEYGLDDEIEDLLYDEEHYNDELYEEPYYDKNNLNYDKDYLDNNQNYNEYKSYKKLQRSRFNEDNDN